VEAKIEAGSVVVEGVVARYLMAGEGPALVLLHGDGDSKFSWSWVLPTLARSHRVYALDLPGFAGAKLPDYTPARFARFVGGFLDVLGIAQAAVIGNSLGGLVALRLALTAPGRVSALGLVDSAGLGVAMTPVASSLAFPGYGEAALGWGQTPFGAAQRNWLRDTLLFPRPGRLVRRAGTPRAPARLRRGDPRRVARHRRPRRAAGGAAVAIAAPGDADARALGGERLRLPRLAGLRRQCPVAARSPRGPRGLRAPAARRATEGDGC
jgi:pimeloyl-ACP methyl ester carboxylesterase